MKLPIHFFHMSLIPFSSTTTLPGCCILQAIEICYILPFLCHFPGYSKNLILVPRIDPLAIYLCLFSFANNKVFFAHLLLSIYFSRMQKSPFEHHRTALSSYVFTTTAATRVWNSLPSDVTASPSLSIFK